jgi:hypothetical protein
VVALGTTEQVREILVGAARSGVALTYSEVLEQLGFAFSRPKMRALCTLLGSVDDEGAERGEPELAVLVVRQSDGVPGQGWWVAGGGSSRHYQGPWQGPEAHRFVSAVQEETFAYWRNRSALE